MPRHWLFAALLLPLSLSLNACAAMPAESASAGSDAVPVADSAPAVMPDDADPALWVIKDEDTTIYLFGTVHILKPGMTWFDEAVKDSFDASEELVVEMIKPDPAVMVKIVNDLAIDKTGISLRDKLTVDDRAKYEAVLTELNLPLAAFDALEPWFASVNLSLIPLMRNGYASDQGADDALMAQAAARGIKITGLETPEQQLGFFDNLPEPVQIRFLNFTIDTIGDSAEGMEQMVIEWANANVDELGELMNAGLEDKILYDTLLVNRNRSWAEWVEQRMKQPGTIFLAVGAGHLAGDSSLQAVLAQKGIVAERIEY
ncbi:MAG: TraB/GumN family protein [Sphingomonadales bacterium]|nr:TraB/GumN family protein [Sphingomonadales bacterium]NCO48080.1 TraB/GumN family protein [Sphingomonadales bacterium]NCO99650.1 TraB/GumN family protein [Sphingomonadales bacterium]NCP27213.1 TraB/GumN family protein [Sphingomonadales bacterium]NCP42118.1 TraB/GumN family protein [Sphingomonadales bacterium]